MSALTKVTVSPHIHSGKSTSGVMRDVLISLLPATVAGIIIFGLRALLVVALCVVCCVGFEALFNVVTKKEQTVGDLSAAVTGLLLALNLPANLPLWQCAVGRHHRGQVSVRRHRPQRGQPCHHRPRVHAGGLRQHGKGRVPCH